MNTIKMQFRKTAFVLSFLILLQGCTVYKSTNLTLDEVAEANNKVRIKTKDNKILKFRRIYQENGIYYGERDFEDKMIKTQINQLDINKVQIKHKAASIILPIGIVLVSLVAFIWAGASGIGFSIED